MVAAQSGRARPNIDWSAVLAGALVAVGSAFVLVALAVGLGLAALRQGDDGSISTLRLVLAGLAALAALFGPYLLGGYIAGRMRRTDPAGVREGGGREGGVRDGINGLSVWGLGMILSGLLLMATLGAAAGAIGSTMRGAVDAAGEAIAGAATMAQDMLRDATGGVIPAAPPDEGAAPAVASETPAAPPPGIDGLLPEFVQGGAFDYITDRLLRAEGDLPQLPEGQRDELRRQITAILVEVARSGEISPEDDGFLQRSVARLTGLAQDQVAPRVAQAVESARQIRSQVQDRVDQARAEAERLRDQAAAGLAEARSKVFGMLDILRSVGVIVTLGMVLSACLAAAAAWFGAVRGGRARDRRLAAPG